ncbi:hypothetical protein Ac2012v2_001016 [Leucoagaricus gongylophorus]
MTLTLTIPLLTPTSSRREGAYLLRELGIKISLLLSKQSCFKFNQDLLPVVQIRETVFTQTIWIYALNSSRVGKVTEKVNS